MSVSRRQFIGALAATSAMGAVADRKTTLPTRILGKTGERVTIIAMGGGSRFTMIKDEDVALEAVNHALDVGITYIDTAHGYGNGVSETRIGKVMKTRRKEVFLATKIADRKGDEAMRRFEASLKRLQTDHVDLVHIHSLQDEDDLAAVEAKDGILNTFYKIRDQKMARFIGITSHSYPSVLKAALERHDFNCTQMALNAALVGMKSGKGGMVIDPTIKESFETIALPVANRKKLGIIAMKIFAQDGLAGQAPPEKLLSYVLSLPVTAATIGMHVRDTATGQIKHLIDSNVQIARTFRPMSTSEMRDLSHRLSDRNKQAFDDFFVHHVDA
jgi:predicted aldo/keto reductase-like oxidoreductase